MWVVGLNRVENSGLVVRIYKYLHRQFSHIIDFHPIDISNSLQVAGFEITDISRRKLWGLPVGIVVGVHKG
jgi:hypothetical protein